MSDQRSRPIHFPSGTSKERLAMVSEEVDQAESFFSMLLDTIQNTSSVDDYSKSVVRDFREYRRSGKIVFLASIKEDLISFKGLDVGDSTINIVTLSSKFNHAFRGVSPTRALQLSSSVLDTLDEAVTQVRVMETGKRKILEYKEAVALLESFNKK